MRRTNQKHNIPTSTPTPTPNLTPKNTINEQPKLEDNPMTLDFECKKEDVDLEEIETDMVGKKTKSINLDDSKKKTEKKPYDIDDTIIRDITLAGDIHVRLLSNTNGYFIDIRKYYKQYPTKKGIRILASKFAIAADMLKNDLQQLIPPQK